MAIHDAARAQHRIYSGTDWAAGPTRRFVDHDVLTEIFPLNEFMDCLEKRRTIIGVGFDCLRAQLERDLLGRTLAFRTDVDIKPVHSRRP